MDALIKAVSAKLNVPAEQLKKEFEQGKFDNTLKNMSAEENAKFNQVLKNPKMLEKLMSAPQAQALYKKLSGEK
ncbi:MAG: hypothetical protein LIO69_03790 [Oscillospiraceae bacterium]|nr:hypothetical protein [Oscillospiraceae bacterium]